METADFTKHALVVRESELAFNAHIVLAGTGSITCLSVRNRRGNGCAATARADPGLPDASVHSISIPRGSVAKLVEK